MKSIYLIAVIISASLVLSVASGNFAFAKMYKQGEMQSTGNTMEDRKKMVEKARALAEEAKRKDLEKFQKDTISKRDSGKKNDPADAARTAVWEKAMKALERYKASGSKK
jgi:hypothetical protein